LKNFSCQYEIHLLRIEATGTGLKMRGTKITAQEHFDGRKELLWKKRKLTYSIMDKPLRQASVVDSKAVNTRVDKAMVLRNTGHKLAPDHPWRNLPIGKSASDGKCATL